MGAWVRSVKLFLQCDVSFHTNFLNQTVTLNCFLIKHCTSLIFMKEKSIVYLINHFLLWVPREAFHAVKL